MIMDFLVESGCHLIDQLAKNAQFMISRIESFHSNFPRNILQVGQYLSGNLVLFEINALQQTQKKY
jgi:hypothetical protein